jgi:hypothetical protein
MWRRRRRRGNADGNDDLDAVRRDRHGDAERHGDAHRHGDADRDTGGV